MGRSPSVSWTWTAGALGALVALNLFIYLQTSHHPFVAFDDPLYVSHNATVLGGLSRQGTTWAFTTFHAGNWHPVTWLSHMLDAQLYGPNPAGHHLTSVLLHVANGLLLFLLLAGTTRAPSRSLLVAALFTVHPLRVESVAWIAERKDVLAGFFWMLTMLAYVRYTRSKTVARYIVTALAFAMGLMAKPMLVTLPVALLLFDAWPLHRLTRRSWGRLVREKLPLLALSAAASIMTLLAQGQSGAVSSLEALPMTRRLANAAVSYVSYIGQTIWPRDLAALYPFPASISGWQVAVAWALLITLTLLALRVARTHAYVAVGWFWYLGTLVPVIGLVQAGSQPMADRFTYVPSIGLAIVVTWAASDWIGRRRVPVALPASAAIVLVCVLAVGARSQAAHWRTSIALWERALGVTSDNFQAHSALGFALRAEGRLDEAVDQYLRALEINPNYAEAHVNLGIARVDQGDLPAAVEQFSLALLTQPANPDAQANLGLALAQSGRPDEAVRHLTEALRFKSDDAAAHRNLGLVLFDLGRTGEAGVALSNALGLDPADARAHHGLGAVRAAQRQPGEAERHYREAVALDPDFGEAHNALGRLLLEEGRPADALRAFEEAVRAQPREPDFHYDLGVVLVRENRLPAAIRALERALELDPNHEAARRVLTALGGSGR